MAEDYLMISLMAWHGLIPLSYLSEIGLRWPLGASSRLGECTGGGTGVHLLGDLLGISEPW